MSTLSVTLGTYADVFDDLRSVSIEQADSYLNQADLSVQGYENETQNPESKDSGFICFD